MFWSRKRKKIVRMKEVWVNILRLSFKKGKCMKYQNIREGHFISRPNRFIAKIDIDGREEVVHVKNTGRCAELLVPGAKVYVQDSQPKASELVLTDGRTSDSEQLQKEMQVDVSAKSTNKGKTRKTRWDLIAVRKGDRLINMDSQVPNKIVKEWLEQGRFVQGSLRKNSSEEDNSERENWNLSNLVGEITKIQPEYTYGQSRIDLYVEAGERKILIEVKGVTLEENGIVRFPDAPSERAVKHVHELKEAIKEGYECYVFFVIQMSGVRYFTPNMDTHPEFGEALQEATEAGVHVVAYDCLVGEDEIQIQNSVPVVLDNPELYELSQVLVPWYQKERRDLPWRHTTDPYRIWVSEIMLQQTRVEAVKRYYARFMEALPDVKALADVEEDKLLKLWEGLGYYNRVRNMQKAARQIMVDYGGTFPQTYEEIRSLTGIGNYTAGAISSFSFGLPYPAVDGNVLRVITRITADNSDIMKQSTRKQMEEKLQKIIPPEHAGDFNQGLIELGAIVCVPNGEPKCEECPAASFCKARLQGKIQELPVKEKAKARRIEDKTVLILRDEDNIAICKRPAKGLLAGLYELPNVEGHLNKKEMTEYCKKIGLMPIHIKKLPEAKHIFSHIEWHMIGYDIRVDELEKTNSKNFLFIHPEEIQREYPIPSAFEKYMKLI